MKRAGKPTSSFSVVRCSIFALTLAPVAIILATLSSRPDATPPVPAAASTPASPPVSVPAPPRRLQPPGAGSEARREQPGPRGHDFSLPQVPDLRNFSAAEHEDPVWARKRMMIGSEAVEGWMNDCPAVPPPFYPKEYPIMDLINNWPPDDATIPPRHYHSLCRFDFSKPGDVLKAEAYREAELPFIIYNVPEAEKVVEKWAKPEYLERLLGNERYRTEVSHNNHFMYYSGTQRGSGKKAWKPPTGVEKMTFKKFKDAAERCDAKNCSESEEHYYFRVTGPTSGHFIFKELPFFQPKKSIFIKDPKGQRGIHCRFGMREVIAENHYDGSRNVIGLFGGRRRYVLSHPKHCDNMYLLPMGHPSGRHSGDACNYHPACKDSPTSVDYSAPDLDRFPKFRKLVANEVIMTAGDFLYLPTHWFHYIISLGLNYQCNTRSGRSNEYLKHMKKCGFK